MKKALLGLLLAVTVLAGIFLARRLGEERASRPRHAYGDMSAEQVTSLKVAYFGDSMTVVKEGGRWVTGGDAFPADTARLRRVLGALLTLQNREIVSQDSGAAGLREFGLDSASARHVSWTLADGRRVKVLLGKVSGIDYGSSFWKPADEAVVYRTPGTFVFELSSRAQDWKDTTLFPAFAPADIRAVAVIWRDSAGAVHDYEIARAGSDTAFTLRAGRDGAPEPARREAAEKIFRHAAQFKIDEFVPGIDTAATRARRAALDEPVMIIRLSLGNGREHVVTVGPRVDGLYRYIRHPWHPDPVRVFVWRFDYFNKTRADFVGEK